MARLDSGEVAEWLKAPHSKCGILARVSGVRIPPSPPRTDSAATPESRDLGIADPQSNGSKPSEVANCTRDFFALSWLFLLPPPSLRQLPRCSFPSAIMATASRNTWWLASPSSFFVLRSGASSEIAKAEIAEAENGARPLTFPARRHWTLVQYARRLCVMHHVVPKPETTHAKDAQVVQTCCTIGRSGYLVDP